MNRGIVDSSARISVGVGALALAGLVAGCASLGQTSAFNARFADNQALATQAIVARLPDASASARPSNSTGAPLVIATTHGQDRHVLAYDVAAGRTVWSVALDAMTRPEVLGDIVLTSVRSGTGATSREEVVALDLADGHTLWTADTHELAYGLARP